MKNLKITIGFKKVIGLAMFYDGAESVLFIIVGPIVIKGGLDY